MIIRILFMTISLLISTQSAPSPYFTRSFVRTPTSSFEQYLIVPDKSDPYRVPLSQVHHYSDFEFPKQQLVYYNPVSGTNQHGLNTLKKDNSLWQEMLLNLHSNSKENSLGNGGSELSKRSDVIQHNDEPIRMVFDQQNTNSVMKEKLTNDALKQDEMNILFQESTTFGPKILMETIAVTSEKSESALETKDDIESMKVVNDQEMNREKIAQDDAVSMEISPQVDLNTQNLMEQRIISTLNASNIGDNLGSDNNVNASVVSRISELTSNMEPIETKNSSDINLGSEMSQESSTERMSMEMALEIVRSAENFPEIIMKLVEMTNDRMETSTRQDSVDSAEIDGNIMASTSSTVQSNGDGRIFIESGLKDEISTATEMTTSTTEQLRMLTTEENASIITESGNLESTNSSELEVPSTNVQLDNSDRRNEYEIFQSITERISESSTSNEQFMSTESVNSNDELVQIDKSTESLRAELTNEEIQPFVAGNEIKTEAVQSSVEITKGEILTKSAVLESTENSMISNINLTNTTQLSDEINESTQTTVDLSTEETRMADEENSRQIIEEAQGNDFMAEEVGLPMLRDDIPEQSSGNVAEKIQPITTESVNQIIMEEILNENITESSEDYPPIDVRAGDLELELANFEILSTNAPLFSESSFSTSSAQSTTDQISSESSSSSSSPAAQSSFDQNLSDLPCFSTTTTTTDRIMCNLLSTTSNIAIQGTTVPLLRELPILSSNPPTTDQNLSESSNFSPATSTTESILLTESISSTLSPVVGSTTIPSVTSQSFEAITEIPSQFMDEESAESLENSTEELKEIIENSRQLKLSPLTLKNIESINSELAQSTSEFDQLDTSTSTQSSIKSIEVSTEEISASTVDSRLSVEFNETAPLRNLPELMETKMVDENVKAENEQDSEEMNASVEENLENSEITSESSTRTNDNKLKETEISSSQEQKTIESNEKQSDLQQEQIASRTEQNIASRNQSAENEREGRINKGPTIFLHNNRFYVISGAPEFYANFDAYRNPRTPIFSLQELQPIRPMNNVAVQKIEPFRIYVEDNEQQKLSTQNDNEPFKMENSTRDSLQSDIENEKSMNAEQNESEKRGEMTVKVKKREQDRQPVGEARRDYDYKEEQPIAQSNPAAISISGNRGVASAVAKGTSFSGIRGFSATSRRASVTARKLNLDGSDMKGLSDHNDDVKDPNNRSARLHRRKLNHPRRRNWQS